MPEQSFRWAGIAIKDRQLEARRRNWTATSLLHDIPDPQDCEHESNKRFLTALDAGRPDASPVNRSEDEKTVLVRRLLHQLHPIGCHELV